MGRRYLRNHVYWVFGLKQMFAFINQLKKFAAFFVGDKKVSCAQREASHEALGELQRRFEEFYLAREVLVAFVVIDRLDEMESRCGND